MTIPSKTKAIDFYRKIPRDSTTEATLSGAGLSIIAALFMILLFGTDLSVATASSIVRKDGNFLRIDFTVSFPVVSYVDNSNILGTSCENGATVLTEENFDSYTAMFPIVAVDFYAPWCYFSQRLKPSWDKAAVIMAERYSPDFDGRILLGKVDCEVNKNLCKKHDIQGYPLIHIFRNGHDRRSVRGQYHHDFVMSVHGQYHHELYLGEQDTNSLVAAMETLVAPVNIYAI